MQANKWSSFICAYPGSSAFQVFNLASHQCRRTTDCVTAGKENGMQTDIPQKTNSRVEVKVENDSVKSGCCVNRRILSDAELHGHIEGKVTFLLGSS